MKSFMKFLVTVLVVLLIGGTVYYLLINGSNVQDGNEILSGELKDISNSGDNLVANSGDEDETYLNENLKNNSGENVYDEPEIDTKERKIERIEEKVKRIESGEIISTMDENLDTDIIGRDAANFIEYFNFNNLPAILYIKYGKVEISPVNDFLNNQVFYYDDNGNLILYETVSNTIGGSTKYYFENGINLDIVFNYEEAIENVTEDISEILSRAQMIYDRYQK